MSNTNPLPIHLRLSHTMAGIEVNVDVGPHLKPEDLTVDEYHEYRDEGFCEERVEQFAVFLEDRVPEVGEFFRNKRIIADAHRPSSDWSTWYAYLDGKEVLAFVKHHHGYQPTDEDEEYA